MYKPQVHVHILHFRYGVFAPHTIIERLRYFLYRRLAAFLQDLSGLPLCENVGRVSKIPLFQSLAVAHQEPAPLRAAGQAVFCEPAKDPAHRHGDSVKPRMLHRLAVDIVAAEQLVGSLARQYDLYMLCSLPA